MTNEEFIIAVKKNPIGFACGAVSLLLAVGLYLRDSKIPDAEAELTQKNAQAERIRLNIQNSAQLKEQAEQLAEAVKEIDTRAVRPGQLGTNTQYFYKLETDTGVKIVDLRQTTSPAGGAKPKGHFLPVAFSVSVQGTLPQIVEFLRNLENGAHYCRVLTASCSTNAGMRSAPLTLTLGLELLGAP